MGRELPRVIVPDAAAPVKVIATLLVIELAWVIASLRVVLPGMGVSDRVLTEMPVIWA